MKEILDYEKLMDALNNYNSLPEKEQKKVKHQADLAFLKMYNDFAQLCANDPELNKAMDTLKEIDEALSFNMEDEFKIYSHTENADDPEMWEDIYVYSPDLYKESKYIYENWDTIKAELEAKIEKVKKSKNPFFKAQRIYKLEQELKQKQKTVDHFAKCLEKQKKKDFYLGKMDEINEMRNIRDQILQKYAEKVVYAGLQRDPVAICMKHTSFISSSGYKSYNMQFMNDICNGVREEATKKLEERNLHSFEEPENE